MVKSDIISASSANHLYWLGRYEERVYMTLHLIRKQSDSAYDAIRTKEMMYDEDNPESLISAQNRAMDNAIVLRGTISTETLGYLEMSMVELKKYKQQCMMNVTNLQPITDWALAFFGSAEQRTQNHKALALLLIGRNIENLDMLVRYNYSVDRLHRAWNSLKNVANFKKYSDENIVDRLDLQFNSLETESDDPNLTYRILSLLSVLIQV